MWKSLPAILVLALWAPLSSAQSVTYTFDGNSSGDQFGFSVSAAGDVNGDGWNDYIVGAPFDDNNGTYSGSVRVFSGLDGSVLYAFNGDSVGDLFGWSVSGAGDVNGDLYADFIVGAPYDDNNGTDSGSAQVFSGYDGSVLYTFDGAGLNDWFGFSVSGAGLVDDDLCGDFMIGAVFENSGPGRVQVFSGLDGSVIHTLNGDTAFGYFGWSLSGVGDFNLDGHDDVVIGCPYGDGSSGIPQTGFARVFSGLDGSLIHTFYGDGFRDKFGLSVAKAGDVDGDGRPDVIVGASQESVNPGGTGYARVFSLQGGFATILSLNGDSQTDLFGFSVSGIGDVNGDGIDDLIVGAPGDDNTASQSGSARVFSGADGSILYTLNGDNAYDEFGHSVSGNGDFIVGARGCDASGSDSGRARVFLGPVQAVPNAIGGGQANSMAARLFVNDVNTGPVPGPFASPIHAGQTFSLDFYGAPNSLYELYGSYTLNPGGWVFPGFGTVDLGTGPAFNDGFIILAGFAGPFTYYSTDSTGSSHQNFYVHPSFFPGSSITVQALIQNAPPFVNGVWATLTAAHQLVIQ